MGNTFTFNDTPLSIENIDQIISNNSKLVLSQDSRKKIISCRNFLDDKLNNSDALFYGINTGFGSLCNIAISASETRLLQENLITSHSCGMGDEVPEHIVKIILILKIQNLSLGYSGVSIETVERLIDFYNNGVLPQIFQLGSLGASGDLAPLAHLATPLIGKGKVRINGELADAEVLASKFGWAPIALKSKEGLALLNGTQFSTAYGVWACIKLRRLLDQANMISALSLDVFMCHTSPFDEKLHIIRPHKGQLETAKSIRDWRADSELAKVEKKSVQDPYAFRCIPQVHGASRDALIHVEQVITTEINAVTDNPTIFPEADEILSGGNFHAQPIALALDYLAIACSEIGSISERRIYQLISGQRDLPAFMTNHAGLHSGFMITQYTAASIASQNKQLASPASVDSIVSCNGQEDHVSMAANAGTRLYRMLDNTERILAIEWMISAKGIDFRRPLKTAAKIEALLSSYREEVSALEEDRILSEDLSKSVSFLQKNAQI